MIYAGLLLFFIFEYIRPADTLIPALAPLRLNTAIPISIVLATFLSRKRVPSHNLWAESNSRFLLALLGLILISVVVAGGSAPQILSTVIGYALIYWVIARQATDMARIKGVCLMLILVHLFLAALTPGMFTDSEERSYLASGTFLGDGNDFALSVNVAIPLCLFLWFDARNKVSKVFYSALFAALVLCVVATRSRGGTIALASVGFYYWLKMDNKLKTGLVAAAVLALILVVAPPSYFARMDTLTNTEEGSAQGRIKAWNAGVWMAIANPVFGVGAGNFARNWGKTAHSIYFLTLGEMGLPGITLLVLFLVSNFRANRRLSSELRTRDPAGGMTEIRLLASTSAALLAFATGGAFLSAIYYPHMYVVAGLLVSARRLARERLQPMPAAVPRPLPMSLNPSWVPRRAVSNSRTA